MRLLVALSAAAPVVAARSEEPPAGRPRADRGFSFRRDFVSEVPWSINIIRISRTNAALTLTTTLAATNSIGLATLSEHVSRIPKDLGKPVAAINGDYFVRDGAYSGDPESLQLMNGELVSAPNGKSCFWIDGNGEPHITNVVSKLEVTWPDGTVTPMGLNEEREANAAVLYSPAMGGSTHTSGGTELVLGPDGDGPWLPLRAGATYAARVIAVRDRGDSPTTVSNLVLSLGPTLARKLSSATNGARLRLSMETLPSLKGVDVAVGGGPALLNGGRMTSFRSSPVRHPRSAVGWSRDAIYLVQVDGRQRDLSVGMTLQELADRMQKLGCEEALNLDGGGSSTMWMLGQVVNSPCEGSERAMGNALVLLLKDRPAATDR